MAGRGRARPGGSTARSPLCWFELRGDKATEVLELADALEQDEDVQRVFHNLA